MKKKRVNIYLIIITICLLISIVGILTDAKFTREIEQDTFNVEFIAGEIELTLTDSETEYIIVPGQEITKDTKVTVKANSEKCYVFIKVEQPENIANYIEYEIGSEWVELEENTNIYYCELERVEEDRDLEIFNNNEILVKDNLTEQELKEIQESNITIDITAYAVQKTSEIKTAEQAWEFINQ